ncbi:hypothetical protein B4U80_14994, partial [Leptotrombidium deliense]
EIIQHQVNQNPTYNRQWNGQKRNQGSPNENWKRNNVSRPPPANSPHGSPPRRKMDCYNCGKLGHIARFCKSRQQRESTNAVKTNKDFMNYATIVQTLKLVCDKLNITPPVENKSGDDSKN